MTNEEKGREYQRLMFQHDMLSNQISQIKGLNFELTESQNKEIRVLQGQQNQIMMALERLMRI
jgi:hypothetical protein